MTFYLLAIVVGLVFDVGNDTGSFALLESSNSGADTADPRSRDDRTCRHPLGSNRGCVGRCRFVDAPPSEKSTIAAGALRGYSSPPKASKRRPECARP